MTINQDKKTNRIIKKKPVAKRNSPATKSRFLIKLLTPLFGIGLVGVAIIGVIVAVTYPKLPSMDELRNYQPKLPLEVFSADGVLLGQFGTEHRIFITYNQTPKMLVNAILAAEDERFFRHGGVDYIGIVRAMITNLTSGHVQSGASTITMQVARNFFLSSTKTFSRKFNEVLLAYKIEKSLTKEQILELYINQIFLGHRSYGFAEAAITYFGKPLDKLTIAEYAVLAGLPKAPSAYNPVVNKKRSHLREMYVLRRMKQLDFITETQYSDAINQKINVIKGSTHDATDFGGYVSEMIRQILYARYGESIYVHGYKVYTTIDSKLQEVGYVALRKGLLQYDRSRGYKGAEKQLNLNKFLVNNQIPDNMPLSMFDGIADFGDLLAAIVINVDKKMIKAKIRNGNDIEITGDDLNFVRKYLSSGGDKQIQPGAVIRVQNVDGKWHINQIPEVEGALISMDPKNGAIKTLIGGFDFTRNGFNHVTQAKRQPGSGFKPFIYSAALNKGLTAATIIDDSPACYPNGTGGSWCPRNSDGEFLGPLSLRQALTKSRNAVTVKIISQITPHYAIDYVTKFGFDKSQFQPYLPMALGSNEVTPLQMAQAYGVFATGGHMVQPYIIDRITDNNGTIIAKTEVTDTTKETQPVIDPRNAFIMNSILQDVARYGTGARSYRELKRNDIAGKTGTTTEARDVWFNGYTPNLVTITWMGYDQPKSLGTHAFGASLALPIWIDFMRFALKNSPETFIPMPPGIIVKPNSTWNDHDEYFIDENYVPNNEEPGVSGNSIQASGVVAEDSSESTADSSQPVKSSASDVKPKPTKDIDDLIKGIPSAPPPPDTPTDNDISDDAYDADNNQ